MQSTSSGGNSLALYRDWAARQQAGGGNQLISQQVHYGSYYPPQQQLGYPQFQSSYGYSPYVQPVPSQREAQILSLQSRLLNAKRDNLRYKQELGRSIIQQQQYYADQSALPDPNNISSLRQVAPSSQNIQDLRVAGSLSARNYLPQQSQVPFSGRANGEERMSARGESGNGYMSTVPPLKLPGKLLENKMHSQETRYSQDDDSSNSTSSLTNPFHHMRLNHLNENLNQIVEDNKKAIENDKTKLLPKAKQKQQEKKNANYQARQDIESLLKKNGQTTKIPLWRHRLQGTLNPPRELIMGGKKLFRAIALSVIAMLIGPARTVYLKKAEKREMNSKEFVKTLQIVTDGVDDWMSKLVQLPIASIVHDDGVDFDPKESFVNGSTSAFRNRMIQLKVMSPEYRANFDLVSLNISSFNVVVIIAGSLESNFCRDKFIRITTTTRG
jgi:hypothetical protein